MKILSNLVMVLVMLTVTTSVQAQASWTYIDGWWEINSDNYEENTIEQESGFLLTMDGNLKLNAIVVTETNPASNSHGYTNGVAITDVVNNITVAETSDSYLYTDEGTSYTTLLSYDVPITEEGKVGPYELNRVIAPTGCPESHCTSCGTGDLSFGASLLRYDYDHTSIDGKVWFEHYGNHRSNGLKNCPTKCGNTSSASPYMRVRCVGHTCSVGSRVIVTIPWGPFGCARFGAGINHASVFPQCYDIGYN